MVVKDPKTWVINRVLLGLLLLAALVVERRLPAARNPDRQIALAIVVVVLSAGMLTTVHWKLPVDFLIRPGTILPRPGNLLPAGLFLLAGFQYRRRLVSTTFPSDFSLYFAAALNLASCLAASESEKVLDAAFILAGMLQFSGFAVLLGGALLDDILLFEKVRQLSVSDPLTGLANYRRLIDTLEHEIQRSGTKWAAIRFLAARSWTGLKKINDSYGHLVGSRALCRVANVLRVLFPCRGHTAALDMGAMNLQVSSYLRNRSSKRHMMRRFAFAAGSPKMLSIHHFRSVPVLRSIQKTGNTSNHYLTKQIGTYTV